VCRDLSFGVNHGAGNSDSGRDILATSDEPTPSGDGVDVDTTSGDCCNT